MAYVPSERICFDSNAVLEFHAAAYPHDKYEQNLKMTKWMFAQYPQNIPEWSKLETLPLRKCKFIIIIGEYMLLIYGLWAIVNVSLALTQTHRSKEKEEQMIGKSGERVMNLLTLTKFQYQ